MLHGVKRPGWNKAAAAAAAFADGRPRPLAAIRAAVWLATSNWLGVNIAAFGIDGNDVLRSGGLS